MENSFLTNGDWILPVTVFGTFAFGAWAVMSFFTDRQGRSIERLKRMSGGHSDSMDGDEGSLVRKSDRVQEILEVAAPTFSKPFLPKSETEEGELKLKLAAAGWRSDNAVTIYATIKVFLTALGFAFGMVTALLLGELNLKMWLFGAFFAGIGYFTLDIILAMRRKKRQDEIFYALPDALDLMVVCVEAGLALDTAMNRVSDEIRARAGTLSRELDTANFQLQMGRPRREVLHDLGVRNGVDDLRSLSAVLIQADKFGSSIGQALRVQSDAMRTRRRQQAEERAQKTAVKLLIPLILFIFPGIFVVLVGPAGITIAKNIGHATGS